MTMPVTYPMFTVPVGEGSVLEKEEAELLTRAEAYEGLLTHPGFCLLMRTLEGRVASALSDLQHNSDPRVELVLLNRWRERVSLMDEINHELEQIIMTAKELKNAGRSE